MPWVRPFNSFLKLCISDKMAHICLFYKKIARPFCFLEERSCVYEINLVDYTGKVKYSPILSSSDVLYMSIVTCSYGFRHQINMTSHFSCTYCLNSQQNKILNFNLWIQSPLYSQIRTSVGKSNTLTKKEVENANVATYNFNSSAPLSSSYFLYCSFTHY